MFVFLYNNMVRSTRVAPSSPPLFTIRILERGYIIIKIKTIQYDCRVRNQKRVLHLRVTSQQTRFLQRKYAL